MVHWFANMFVADRGKDKPELPYKGMSSMTIRLHPYCVTVHHTVGSEMMNTSCGQKGVFQTRVMCSYQIQQEKRLISIG